MNTRRVLAVFRGNERFLSLPGMVFMSKERHSRSLEKENFPVV